MSEDLMGYRLMAQEALRDVVRQALRRTQAEGLPGAHHFYITFDTRQPGVDLDDDLLEQFPEQMTIVLEHQFWDLEADEDGFEVTLKFSGVPKYIRVPFAAIVAFHDPSVEFALRFDIVEPAEPARLAPADGEAGEDEDADDAESATVVSLDAFRKRSE